MSEESRRTVYDAVTTFEHPHYEGVLAFDLGSWEDFNAKMDNIESREKLYKNIQGSRWIVGDDTLGVNLGEWENFNLKLSPRVENIVSDSGEKVTVISPKTYKDPTEDIEPILDMPDNTLDKLYNLTGSWTAQFDWDEQKDKYGIFAPVTTAVGSVLSEWGLLGKFTNILFGEQTASGLGRKQGSFLAWTDDQFNMKSVNLDNVYRVALDQNGTVHPTRSSAGMPSGSSQYYGEYTKGIFHNTGRFFDEYRLGTDNIQMIIDYFDKLDLRGAGGQKLNLKEKQGQFYFTGVETKEDGLKLQNAIEYLYLFVPGKTVVYPSHTKEYHSMMTKLEHTINPETNKLWTKEELEAKYPYEMNVIFDGPWGSHFEYDENGSPKYWMPFDEEEFYLTHYEKLRGRWFPIIDETVDSDDNFRLAKKKGKSARWDLMALAKKAIQAIYENKYGDDMKARGKAYYQDKLTDLGKERIAEITEEDIANYYFKLGKKVNEYEKAKKLANGVDHFLLKNGILWKYSDRDHNLTYGGTGGGYIETDLKYIKITPPWSPK